MKSNKYKKAVAAVFYLLLFLTLAGITIVEIGITNARQALKYQIEEVLPQGYSLSYEQLKLNYWEPSIHIKHLNFFPDSLEQLEKESRLLYLHIPSFDIHLKSIYNIFTEKKLIIEGLSIEDPKITVRDFSTAENATLTSKSINLFELITRYLNLFEIQQMDIKDARFHYDIGKKEWIEKLRLEDIDFVLTQFSIDSTMIKHRFFNSESIELTINKESFDLPDQFHRVSFDQFRLSTQDSVLTFKNVRLQPRSDSKKLGSEFSTPGYIYNITVPEIALRGVDYYRSYLQGELSVKKALLSKPAINIRPSKTNQSAAQSTANIAPLEILSKFAPLLHVDHIQLEEGSVKLDLNNANNRTTELFINQLNLFNCSFDSREFTLGEGQFPFSHFEAELQAIRHELPDRIHEIKLGKLLLNSEKESLRAFDVNITPKNSVSSNGKPEIIQSFPQIYLSGVDFGAVYFDKPVFLNHCILNRPNTTLGHPITIADTLTPSFRLEALFKRLHKLIGRPVKLNNLTINQGVFLWDPHLSIDQYNLTVKKIELNSGIRSFEKMLSEFDLHIQKGKGAFPGNTFQIDTLFTNGKSYGLKNIEWAHQSATLKADFAIPSLVFEHHSLDSFFAKKLFFDSIQLSNPQIAVRLPKDTAPSMVKHYRGHFQWPFHCPALIINNAVFSLHFPNGEQLVFDRHFSRCEIDSSLDIQEFALHNFRWRTAQDSNKWAFKHISKVANNHSFIIDSLRIYPTRDSAVLRNPLHFPQIQLIDLDQKKFFQREEVALKKLIFAAPRFDLSFFKRNEHKEIPAIQLPLPITIDSVVVEGGTFASRLSHLDSGSIFLNVLGFNWYAEQVEFKAGKQLLSSWSDWVEHWRFQSLQPITIASPELDIAAEQVYFQSPAGKGELDALKIHQTVDQWKHSTAIESMEVEGLSLNDLFDNQQFIARSLTIGATETEICLFDSFTKKEQNFPFSKVQMPFEKIQLDHLYLPEADFIMTGKAPFGLKGMNVKVSGLHLPSRLALEHIDQHFEHLKFGFDQFDYLIGKKDFYRLNFGLAYDSGEKKIILKDSRVQPMISLEQYSKLKRYRSDYLDLMADSILIYSDRLGAFFEEAINLKGISAKGASIAIIRDENLPLMKKEKPLLQDQIKSIPYPFRVENLLFKGNIFFMAIPKDSETSAWITVDSVETRLSNISNQPTDWLRPLQLLGKGKFYKEGDFMVRMNFDMQDTLNAFDMRGWMGPMDLKNLNHIFTPLSRVSVRKGYSKEMSFDISANTNYAIGEMLFKYNKLRLMMVDKDNIHKVGFGNRILSFWANQIVKSNNPAFIKLRKGIVYFERNQYKETVNLWVHAMLSGMVSSIGMKNNRKKLKKMGIEDLEALDYQKLFGDIIKK